MENEEKKPDPSYYAVIPASVRYNKDIPSGAKLLYGEITSLCHKKGYCWAQNSYFSNLYMVSERTIINWINSLKNYGYIEINFTYVSGRKEVEKRLIRLAEAVKNDSGKITLKEGENAPEAPTEGIDVVKIFSPPNDQNSNEVVKIPTEQNDKNTSEVVKNSSPPGENNFTTYGKNIHEVVKISSKGGEKNFRDNTTSNNKTTTAAFGNPETDEEPLPPVEAVVAAAFSPEELKKTFLAVDNRLIFDRTFYPRALAFMADKGLENKYISWLRDQCENKDYRDFKSLYYSLFFKDSFAEEFLILTKAEEKEAENPQKNYVCPACNTTLGIIDKECPECKLTAEYPSPEQIELHKELIKLNKKIREEYLSRESKVYSECKKDFVKLNQKLKNLRNEYNIAVV